MSGGYRLTPTARAGFQAILDYAEDTFGWEVAERVAGNLERAFVLLAENPSAGHARKDLTTDPRTRFWSVGPTLIAYRSGSPGIEVLFVARGELDWESRMFGGDPRP